MRGLPSGEANLRAADGAGEREEVAVVLRLREESRGGVEHQRQEMRGLRPEGTKPRAAIGWEEAAVVQGLRAGGGVRHEVAEDDCPEDEVSCCLRYENGGASERAGV